IYYCLDIFVLAMLDLYPDEFTGKNKKEIIEHCYDYVHPFYDMILYEFSTWCLCPEKETPLEFMQNIIMRHVDLLYYGDGD
uniref:hypothetical protein n=1 Tax=Salmonella enterica TaxID=28901 RepID=UPI003075DF9B